MTLTPRDILAQNRRDAIAYSERTGVAAVREVLKKAEADLVARLAAMRVPTTAMFSRETLNATLVQVRHVLLQVGTGMTSVLTSGAEGAAEQAAGGTIDYLARVEALFRGGAAPLDLDTASMFERAKVGARSSILQRLATSGEPQQPPGGLAEPHRAKPGILQRYGLATIGDFEDELRTGILARRSWTEQKQALVAKSPFLQGNPGFWAERIVRTESMGAYSRGAWEANRDANEQLGDMLKIVAATFDDRTSSDSYAVHGQIRRPDEAFESWFGLYQHPPNRPNDREVVVPHRISWPIPDYLKWRTDAEIAERWTKEKRKGPPPARPKMTSIDVSRIGQEQPPPRRRPPRASPPPEPDDE